MRDNGDKGERKRKCPFLNEWCIGDGCELRQVIHKNVGGMRQSVSVCAFTALVVMISEINMKAQAQQQKVMVPNILRG